MVFIVPDLAIIVNFQTMKRFKSFEEFYPYYLEEHRLPRTKLFHFFGTLGSIVFVILAIFTKTPWILLLAALSGYGTAWLSHFFIEKNKPATFKYPLYSLTSDFRMFFEILLGKHKIL